MKVTQEIVTKALDYAYTKAVDGVPGLDSATELAANYRAGDGSLYDKANQLIRWQNVKATTTGFVAGIPGLIAIPVTLPADITSLLYIQIRMIASIAVLGGYNVKDDKVKTLVYSCLVASSAADILKNVGVQVGQKIAIQMIKRFPRKYLITSTNELRSDW